MKKCYLIIVLFVFLSSITFSQDKKAEVFINGGIAMPFTPETFKDYWSLGYNIGGGAGYRFSPNISGSASLGFNTMIFNEEGFLNSIGLGGLGLSVQGADVKIIMVTANVKFSLAPKASASPYFIGGIGFFNISADDMTVSYMGQVLTAPGPSEGAFGALIGAGVDIPVSPTVAVFLEIDWGMGFTEGDFTGYLPAKGGILILL